MAWVGQARADGSSLAQAAQSMGLTQSEWARDVMNAAAEGILAEAVLGTG
jgi:ABC-type phosphate transport system permease subunit